MATVTTIATFPGPAGPYGGELPVDPSPYMAIDASGDLLGTQAYTASGNSDGAIFEISDSASGYASAPTTLVSFDGSDGATPEGGLVADTAGNLFGATGSGGANDDGTIFELADAGSGYASAPIVLASFDGQGPSTPLVMDSEGDLFGITGSGGSNTTDTVFELAKAAEGYASAPTTLAEFDASYLPAPLAIDANGDLFTVTNGGAVIELAKTADGYASTATTLATLGSSDGSPAGALVVDAAGNLFGVTNGGGANGSGEIFEIANTTDGYADTAIVLTSFPQENDHGGALIIDGADNLFVQAQPSGGPSGGELYELPKTDGIYPSTLTAVAQSPFSTQTGLTGGSSGDIFGATNGYGQLGGYTNSTIYEVTGTGYVPSTTSTGETLGANDTAGQQLTGTPLNDTFYAGHNSVVMTGDGGADTFIFQYLPWNAGSITDFDTATDILDLSGIFDTIGYSGDDPVGDGYLQFVADGQGDTQVYVDPQGPGTQTPILITTLDGVSPSSITPADYGYGSNSGGSTGSAAITISGTVADQNTINQESIQPFAHVTLADTNSGATETLTVALSPFNQGALSNLDGGSYNEGTGVYTVTGTLTEVNAALDGLVYTPEYHPANAGQTITTTFTISDSDSAGTSASDSTTSVDAVWPQPNLITLANLTPATGDNPAAALLMDSAGDLFGTSLAGGSSNNGAVFEIADNGGSYASTPTVIASFDGTDGARPQAGLTIDDSGNLLGATDQGGPYENDNPQTEFPGYGTVFEIANTGSGYATSPTDLATFDGSNGTGPWGTLVADSNGDLFGTTVDGGAHDDGTIFEIADTGSGYADTPTILASFDGSITGDAVRSGLLVDSNGDLIGTASVGGPTGDGTVFELVHTATGYETTPTVLYQFSDSAVGTVPIGGLVADAAGDLFGTTTGSGGDNYGSVFEIPYVDGSYGSAVALGYFAGTGPDGNLLLDAAGDIFGTTAGGGADGDGSVYEIPKTAGGYGDIETIFSFNGADGKSPESALIADANGNLFGTTYQGGSDGQGTVFELTNTGFITNVSNGEVLVANNNANENLVGTTGPDTFYAEQNSVIMTGDGGHDTFVFNALPWNAGSITDFNTATDTLNLSGIFNTIGYTGDNPVGDGYLTFQSDGNGNTLVYVDSHQSSDPWPTLITTLDGVAPSSITPADYGYGSNAGGGSSGGGSGGGGQTVDDSQPNYTVPDGVTNVVLTGSAAQTVTANNEGDTITSNDYGSTIIGGTGNDTLIAGHGADQLTGGGGDDSFVYNYLPWNAGTISDFNTATDALNLSGIMQSIGYSGSNPQADGYVNFVDDGQGDTKVYVNPQGPSTQIPILVTTLEHVSASALHQSGDYVFT